MLGSDSKPVAGANVNMQGEGQPFGQTTTDAAGHFSFDAVCEGPVRLSANRQGEGGRFLNGNIETQGGDTNAVIRLGVNVQGVGRNTPVVTTSGKVLDASGAPVGRALLSVMSPNGMTVEVKSGLDGAYSITWQKNNFGGGQSPFVLVHDAEHHLAVAHDLDETATNLDLRLQPALTLSVKVQDAQGKPIPSATASLFIQTSNSSLSIGQMPVNADAQGVIGFPDLAQERQYRATVSAAGYGSATALAQVEDTKTTRFEFPAAVLKVEANSPGRCWVMTTSPFPMRAWSFQETVNPPAKPPPMRPAILVLTQYAKEQSK